MWYNLSAKQRSPYLFSETSRQSHLLFVFFFFFSDIDECAENTHSCSFNAVCSNTKGAYNCTCKPGYHGDGNNCTAAGEGSVHATCKCYLVKNIFKFHDVERNSYLNYSMEIVHELRCIKSANELDFCTSQRVNKTLSCALSMVCFYFISYTLDFFHDRHM